jgi:hypothetical protein
MAHSAHPALRIEYLALSITLTGSIPKRSMPLLAAGALIARCRNALRVRALDPCDDGPNARPKRRAAQGSPRNSRPAGSTAAKVTPVWRASMPVLWKGRADIFRREVGDGEAGLGSGYCPVLTGINSTCSVIG